MERKIRTCRDCLWKYEVPADRDDIVCPICGPTHVGVGSSFNDACRNALKKLRAAGRGDRPHGLRDHFVRLVDSDTLVHVVVLDVER